MDLNQNQESDEARILWAVLRLARRLRHPLAHDEPIGSGLGLLASLQRNGPMSAATLARTEGLKPQSVSLILTRLERQGLIGRRRDAVDRRRHQIDLTRAGDTALRKAMGLRRTWLATAMSRQLNDQDRQILVASAALMLQLAEFAEDGDCA